MRGKGPTNFISSCEPRASVICKTVDHLAVLQDKSLFEWINLCTVIDVKQYERLLVMMLQKRHSEMGHLPSEAASALHRVLSFVFVQL